jgi:hypothetical protein
VPSVSSVMVSTMGAASKRNGMVPAGH